MSSATRQRFENLVRKQQKTLTEDEEMSQLGLELIADTHRIVSKIWHKLASGDARQLEPGVEQVK